MKKKINILILGLALEIGCYAIIVSLLSLKGNAYYISFLFTLIAAGIQLLCIGKLFSEPDVTEYFYRIPAIQAGIGYVTVQFIAGAILSIINTGVKSTVIIEVIILGIFGSWELRSLYEGQRAETVQESYQDSISDYRKLQAKAKSLVNHTTDFEWKQKAKAVYEAVNFMDPVSSLDSMGTEMEIFNELNQMEEAIRKQDSSEYEEVFSRIRFLLSQRN